MKENKFVVLAKGDSGVLPLAVSKHQSKAIGYAYMCKHDAIVKSCSALEIEYFSNSFYLLNLD